MDALAELDRLTREAERDELPRLLGRLTEAEARVRLRLAEVPSAPVATSRTIDAIEAAVIASTTKRWLLTETRGEKFRHDLSRKKPRFDEAGLRAWLATRRR